jgi:UDP-N-acetyl-alpha-D-quinovosamine dehydrogenase
MAVGCAEHTVIAVTGANGFIGRAFCARAAARGRRLRRFVRRGEDRVRSAAEEDVEVHALDLARATVDDVATRLTDVRVVIHLGGRAHVMRETAGDSEAAYRSVNELATLRVAEAAVAAGVRRFVLASSVKVNGEHTERGHPFRPEDPVAPEDAYARSKWAAEGALRNAAKGSSMSAVVLRLPLVYGPGARGNFRRLVDAVRKRRWLPFGAIDNRRSLLGIENLLDALDAAIDAPDNVEGVHFVADEASISTPDLVRAIARALGTEARLVPVPVPLLRIAGRLAARTDAIERLTRSLEVDTSSFAAATGWRARRFAIDSAMVGDAGDRGI